MSLIDLNDLISYFTMPYDITYVGYFFRFNMQPRYDNDKFFGHAH